VGGCVPKPLQPQIIKIKGSDTMLQLVSNLAEKYMQKNVGVSIYVSGGGTRIGVENLINGETDICAASRVLTSKEAQQIAAKFNSLGISFLVAKDALSVYINEKNKKKNFTLNELKNIFSGDVKNWKEIGGEDASIVPIIRNHSSGTHLYFKQHILNEEEYSEAAISKATTRSVIKEIVKNKNAIGYGGIGYNEGQYFAGIENVEPTEKNIMTNTYPIIRYLYFLTINKPTGEIKKFLDWVISDEGQQIIQSSGFIRIWNKTY